MKFDFKPVKKSINIAEYAPEMSGAVIEVRVNVSREVMGRMMAVSKETSDADFFALLGELWGREDWPDADIEALRQHCAEHDPQLWLWLTRRTFDLVFEYRAGQKK